MRLLGLLVASFAVVVSAASSYNATCTRKLDVRPEWRNLSDGKKKAFIDALKCLDSIPHQSNLAPSGGTPNTPPLNESSSLYDDFVYAHIDSNVKDHFTAIFLPWHRWYLYTFQETLKTRCNYNDPLPFWDWSKDSGDVLGSPVFNSSKTHGLGTVGKNETNWEVRDGAFGDVLRAYPKPHIVQRQYTNYPFRTNVFPFPFTTPNLAANDTFTPKAVQALVSGSRGNFTDFAYKLDGVRAQGMHNAAHLMMGGDLSNPYVSPNDPLFWIHHANIDCIWARWQAQSPKNKVAFGGGLTQDLPGYDVHPVGAPPAASKSHQLPTVGLTGPVSVEDVFWTQNSYLCYKCAY